MGRVETLTEAASASAGVLSVRSELLAGSDDYAIRVFREEEVVAEVRST
jgi:hypothetical protein